jgi:hypothetical protein
MLGGMILLALIVLTLDLLPVGSKTLLLLGRPGLYDSTHEEVENGLLAAVRAEAAADNNRVLLAQRRNQLTDEDAHEEAVAELKIRAEERKLEHEARVADAAKYARAQSKMSVNYLRKVLEKQEQALEKYIEAYGKSAEVDIERQIREMAVATDGGVGAGAWEATPKSNGETEDAPAADSPAPGSV